jgi:hypothetical protein
MIHRPSEPIEMPKRARGRTAIENTPITTRSRVPLAAEARRSIEQRLRRALLPFGPRIERATIRFEDLNGPRGGAGLECSIKVVLSGTQSLLIEQRATEVLEAVRLALPRVARAVRQHADRSSRKTPAPTKARAKAGPRRRSNAAADVPKEPASDASSLMDKRAGRRRAGLPAALARPEKLRRDAWVDTAAEGVSQTDRKAGGGRTARRNSKAKASSVPYALEDSLDQPSRKSTRSGGDRVKAATQLARRAQRKVRSPAARAARGR